MNVLMDNQQHYADRLEKRNNSTAVEIWRILDQVLDPEIPVLSLWDLGILTNICQQNNQITITITPTYSGCPAIDAMRDDILQVLSANGIKRAVVQTRLSPAWSSTWLSPEGQKKLNDYGIAPPNPAYCAQNNKACTNSTNVGCPHCQSNNTHRISEFGSTACKALHQCDDCLEPFDYFKTL